MIKALGYVFGVALLLMLCMRIGNAMLVRDQAVVLLDPFMCTQLEGQRKDGLCEVVADYSHDFITGSPMLRKKLKDGSFVTIVLLESAFKGAVVQQSHYEFFKSWM